MKYYVDKGTNRLHWFGMTFCLIFPIWAIISLLTTSMIDGRLIYCCIVLYPAELIISYLSRRLNSFAKISTSTVRSYSMFGRKYCSVFLDQIVYFISFECYVAKTQYKGETRPFIALSNQPFTYYDPTKKSTFLGRYDLHTIVVLPYDDRTKPLLPVDKWIQVV